MDGMRVLDQHIDRSLLRIEPTEAAQYQFIWSSARPRTCPSDTTATVVRRPREDDERTLTSVDTESRRSKKGVTEGGGARSGLLGMMVRGVKAPRKQMKKLLQQQKGTTEKGKTEEGKAEEGDDDSQRRSSEATLVERLGRQEEKKEPQK